MVVPRSIRCRQPTLICVLCFPVDKLSYVGRENVKGTTKKHFASLHGCTSWYPKYTYTESNSQTKLNVGFNVTASIYILGKIDSSPFNEQLKQSFNAPTFKARKALQFDMDMVDVPVYLIYAANIKNYRIKILGK